MLTIKYFNSFLIYGQASERKYFIFFHFVFDTQLIRQIVLFPNTL
jgi:hypothetical protein